VAPAVQPAVCGNGDQASEACIYTERMITPITPIRLSAEMLARIDAARGGQNRSAWIREALVAALPRPSVSRQAHHPACTCMICKEK
jgi:hypothetical protein